MGEKMGKYDDYIDVLHDTPDWDTYLLEHSGLPGPRGNLELAHAAGAIASVDQILRWLENRSDIAPTNDPREFLAFCGVIGLGHQLANGETKWIIPLRKAASDYRWRMREAVSQAVTIWAKTDMQRVLDELVLWSEGSLLECRAAAASVADLAAAKMLGDDGRAIPIMHRCTQALRDADPSEKEAIEVLQKGLSYCWSVVLVAQPDVGKAAFEEWMDCEDKKIRKVLTENLKKKRLLRLDAAWVDQTSSRLT